ncbi:restriction endonuclease subunit S [Streptomyces platensis]|uniref:restriction endonuclease subunit S n=1 Tax=Streptomyces platensis TaxID=58346 RepID=UPI00386ABAEE|nr:restriction endonuclease subunit S [Streptomyces platensis]
MGSIIFPKVGAAMLKNPRRLLGVASAMDNNLMAVVPMLGDPRFWLYALSMVDLGEISGSGPIPYVNEGQIRELRIPFPSLETQRCIADFLDAETARVDWLIQLRTRQIALVGERCGSALDHEFRNPNYRRTRLKYLLEMKPRYGVLVPVFVDEGVNFIRVNDLIDLNARTQSLSRIPTGLSSQYSRTVTRSGDVLLSVVGEMRRVAIIRPALAGANVARAVALLRVNRGVAPELIASWLATPDFLRQSADATGSDTAQPTLGMEDLANFTLSWPDSPQEQKRLLDVTTHIQNFQNEFERVMRKQQRLLAERRQALITAAVTGQFDVSTASGRNVTDGITV